MTIIDIQDAVIQKIKDGGYSNVKDSLLIGITENETYPIVVVDIESSSTLTLASGGYTKGIHHLLLSVYAKASGGISNARKSVAETLDAILLLLGYSVFEDKIEYTDTVLNNIKVCAVGCIIEVSAY